MNTALIIIAVVVTLNLVLLCILLWLSRKQ